MQIFFTLHSFPFNNYYDIHSHEQGFCQIMEIRDFYFDLKYQGKIRGKKKRKWKSGKNQGNFFLLAVLNESFLIKDCF